MTYLVEQKGWLIPTLMVGLASSELFLKDQKKKAIDEIFAENIAKYGKLLQKELNDTAMILQRNSSLSDWDICWMRNAELVDWIAGKSSTEENAVENLKNLA